MGYRSSSRCPIVRIPKAVRCSRPAVSRGPTADESTLTVTARRRDETVGVLWALNNGAASRASALVVGAEHRDQGIAHHLHARFLAEVDSDDQVRRHT